MADNLPIQATHEVSVQIARRVNDVLDDVLHWAQFAHELDPSAAAIAVSWPAKRWLERLDAEPEPERRVESEETDEFERLAEGTPLGGTPWLEHKDSERR